MKKEFFIFKKHFEDAVKLLRGKQPNRHEHCKYNNLAEVAGEFV